MPFGHPFMMPNPQVVVNDYVDYSHFPFYHNRYLSIIEV